MSKGYLLAGLVALGLACFVGWATLGTAQPSFDPPGKPPAPIRIPDIEGTTPNGQPNPPQRPRWIGVTEPVLEPIDASRLIPQPSKDSGTPMTIGDPSTKAEDLSPDQGQPKTGLEAPTTSSRQDPAVSLEWLGPSAVKVGMPVDYTLAVRNSCNIPLQKVIVQVRVPSGVNVVNTEPKAEGADSVLVWEFGTLLARQERRLSIKLLSPQRGDMACQAWVTFTGSSVMKMHVREPKLLVKINVPEKVLVGDPANVVMTISNPGDHPAEHVRIVASLAEGLESIRGNKLNYELGTLTAGETRTVTVPCVSKSTGPQKCDVSAEADGGLKAGDNVALNVIQPRLDLVVTGPKMRYLDKKATYTVKVANPGDAPAANVFITEAIPAGFKFVGADSGGQLDEATRSVKWFIGELGAGQSKEVKVELLAASTGEFAHRVHANAARGMQAQQELKTVVEGLSAIQMELVDTEDPVEVGSDTSYEIKVTNTGSKAETDVRLVCTIPTQLKLKSVQGPVKYELAGNEVIFQPLPRLAPRADVVYKVTVTAQTKGDARFKAALTTTDLVEPVVKIEPTKVYAE